MKLDDVKENSDKVNICVYGPSGTGKTRLISTIPTTPDKILIINADKGLLTLKKLGDFKKVKTVNNYSDISEVMKYLSTADCASKYEWVVFDSVSVIAELLSKHLKEDKKLTGFDFWREYGDKLCSIVSLIRDQEQYHTLSIFESVSKDDDSGVRQHKFGILGSTADKVPYFYDIVLASQSKKKGEVVHYFLQTQSGGGWTAKDRSGTLLPQEEPNITNIVKKILG